MYIVYSTKIIGLGENYKNKNNMLLNFVYWRD